MDPKPSLLCWLLVASACALDRLIGDPAGWRHPVQLMGDLITPLRQMAERLWDQQPLALRAAGSGITVLVVGISGLAGWACELLAQRLPLIGVPLLLLGLASALAGRSLEQAVQAVMAALPEEPPPAPRSSSQGAAGSGAWLGVGEAGSEVLALEPARSRLAWIVGRDVSGLDRPGILRACAETASENAVDGLFAPLFWMLTGSLVWGLALAGTAHGGVNAQAGHRELLPAGPLALAWMFKASSTLDSMLGYRRGNLRWLGTAGARLDDALTWLPCRLVALSLPLVAGASPKGTWRLFRRAQREGAADPSPNAGVSQAAYALAAGVRLGGVNHYGGLALPKPLLGRDHPEADAAAVQRILDLTTRLEVGWLALALPLLALATLLAPAASWLTGAQ